jgi:uncharacterized protein (DUF1778 family)
VTIDLRIEGEAAEEINDLARASGESVTDFVGDAVATKKWVDEAVRGGRLFIMEDDGRLREVSSIR